ncbi:MAG: hypothetical protein FWD28_05850 [Treponema sp.]|nr:hypothetical protein [Treponema sp.]
MFGNFFKKRQQKKLEMEQKRREEYEKLREKLKTNETFTKEIKSKINDLYAVFKEFEEAGKKTSEVYEELEEQTGQIDILNTRSYKFIFKLINDWNIRKLTRQREKNKQKIENSEKTINEKKEEIRKTIYGLLDFFE